MTKRGGKFRRTQACFLLHVPMRPADFKIGILPQAGFAGRHNGRATEFGGQQLFDPLPSSAEKGFEPRDRLSEIFHYPFGAEAVGVGVKSVERLAKRRPPAAARELVFGGGPGRI